VKKVEVVLNSKSDKYKFISKTLVRLKYNQVRKKDKILIKLCLKKNY
jgi:hypothetical protein